MDTPERPAPVDPGFMSVGPVPAEQDEPELPDEGPDDTEEA
jgi:hypothetical protein